MFTISLWCLLFDAMICLAVKEESPDDKKREMNEALGKVILKMLGMKNPPKLKKEFKEKVPQFILDEYNKQVDESVGNGDLSSRKTSTTYCKRRPFYVSFDEIYGKEKNFVIAPVGFDAFHCQGECPFPLDAHMNTTNHAIIQTIVHSIDNNTVPAACCVPTTPRPLTIFYRDENKVEKKEVLQDMIVEECGYR